MEVDFFSAIYLGRVEIPSFKADINLPWTYKKLIVEKNLSVLWLARFFATEKKLTTLYKRMFDVKYLIKPRS